MTSLILLIAFMVELLNVLVIIWCLLTWFPNVRWYDQPFRTLDQIVRPIIAPFRKLIPPIGNIDFSALVALIVLQVVAAALREMAAQF
jgi:YggT family protein